MPAECRYFNETGHSLCQPFLGYWERNGGLLRFGYPITEPFVETISTWEGVVQYFERRRMELHAEQPGLPVLLGLLGNEVLNRPTPITPGVPGVPGAAVPECVAEFFATGTAEDQVFREAYQQLPFRETLGCPTTYVNDVPAATQMMERGAMVWIDLSSRGSQVPFTLAGRLIYTIYPGPAYQRYPDTWVAGIDPMRPNIKPPRDGLYPPWGGFGKLWMNDSTVRDRLGWAVESRADEDTADVVIFDNVYNDLGNLGMLIQINDTDTIYAFGRLDQPQEVATVYDNRR
ncbi:MAG: hypothetical protein HC914_00690 [Chloroflexaceae bacterium]|nr:hypothetical protein [Chloroflexaceae bacterium]